MQLYQVKALSVVNTYCIPCPEWSTWKPRSVWPAVERKMIPSLIITLAHKTLTNRICHPSSGARIWQPLWAGGAQDYNLATVVHFSHLVMLLSETFLRYPPAHLTLLRRLSGPALPALRRRTNTDIHTWSTWGIPPQSAIWREREGTKRPLACCYHQ